MLLFISIWWKMNDLTSILTHNILKLHIVWINDTELFLALVYLLFAACPVQNIQMSLIHMLYHRWYKFAYEFVQADILPLQETVSLPCGPVRIDSPPLVIYKLHCYAVCSIGSPSQLYCSAHVSASLLLSQTWSCSIYSITEGLLMGYSSARGDW
jgi:hypothetical protein